jgi:hypothetical protein
LAEVTDEGAKMAKSVFQSLWTVVPVFCGIFLYSIVWPDGESYVSLFWSLIFGLSECIFLWIPYDVVHPTPYFPFVAAFGWPLLVGVFLAWISGIVWESLQERGRWIALAVLVLLSGSIVPLKRAEKPPINSWPSYQNVTASLW